MITTLQPRLDALAASSPRTATISKAKLARAYANAGQPTDACRLAADTLDAAGQVGLHSAQAEIRRTAAVLRRRWQERRDAAAEIADLTHRLDSAATA